MEWFRNIYGDEINSVSLRKVYRSFWKCKHCDKIELREKLHTPNDNVHLRETGEN